jgi:hypothetical protein
LLCRTSNPGGDDLQTQRLASVAGTPRLFEHLAHLAQSQWNLNGQLGLVVGATYPAEIARVREIAPSLPLLIPGIGAQGGDAQATVVAALSRQGPHKPGPIIVNSSRAILYASSGADYANAARHSARSSRDVLNFVFAKGIDAAELIVLVFCYLVFFFLGSRKFEARVGHAFPGERGQRILAVGEGISESMERFMMVKSVIGVGMGLSAAGIMWLFGLDHWPLWAFLFFAANYVTSIGSWAACVPPILMAALDLGAVPATILAVLIVVMALTTAVAALGSVLIPVGIIAVIALAAWVWLGRR